MWVSRLLLSSETRKCDCTEQALLQDSALRELGSAALYRGGRELTSAPAQPPASLPHAHQAESALSALGDLHTRKGASSKGHRGRRGGPHGWREAWQWGSGAEGEEECQILEVSFISFTKLPPSVQRLPWDWRESLGLSFPPWGRHSTDACAVMVGGRKSQEKWGF